MKLTKPECYTILGVPENASDKEIKKRYRTLAKEYHPDVSPSPKAEERFALISRAYDSIVNNDFKIGRATSDVLTKEDKEKKRKERFEAAKKRFEAKKRKEKEEEEIAFQNFKNKKRPWLLVASIPFIIMTLIGVIDLMLPYEYETFAKSEYKVSEGIGIPTILSFQDSYSISVPSNYRYQVKTAPFVRVQKLGLSKRIEGLD